MSESEKRVAVVTGAAQGIGKAVADRFEAEGWSVLRCDVVESVGDWSAVVDVRSEEAWAGLAEEVSRQHGRLDVLVNNAAVFDEAPLGETTTSMWDRLMDVNLKGTFLGCRTMLPHLRQGSSPAILNFASIDALRGSHRHTAYAATKGGIVAMTRALALELAADGIRVNAICPGTVDTPMVAHMLGEQKEQDDRVDRVSVHPLGRVSTPEEQAAAALFLCSQDASFVTGVALSVDGGRAIR